MNPENIPTHTPQFGSEHEPKRGFRNRIRFRRRRWGRGGGGPVPTERVKLRERMGIHIYVLPNLLTTCNMFFGFFGIIYSIKGEFQSAAYAVVAAAVFDMLDGRVARITRATSQFGAEYDSLSDLVSFCVSPAIMLYLWALQPFGRVGWLVSFLFVACGALRLARFNVQSKTSESKDFQGLPTPMAAGIVASSFLAFQELELDGSKNPYLLAMCMLLAFVMVSTFRYRSFKDLDLKERLPFRYLVAGVSAIVLVAWRPEVMLFFLFLTYALLGAIFGILKLGRRNRKPAEFVVERAGYDTDLHEEVEE